METGRAGRINLWLTISLTVVITLVVIAAILPIFSRARHTAYQPESGRIAKEQMASRSDLASMPSEIPGWGATWAASTPRMVISTADLRLEVPDVQKAHNGITETVREVGGFITQSGINRYDGRKTASVTIRVPAKNYQSALAEISKLGKVVSRNEKGEDVTEEYVDLESRIRNLKREEEQFLKVLGRAGKVTDILAVERELARVRGEIEQATGRIQFLRNQVDLATINVDLSEPLPAVSAIVAWDISRTAKGAVNALQVVFRAITSLVVWTAIFTPFWMLIGVVVYGCKRYRRARL